MSHRDNSKEAVVQTWRFLPAPVHQVHLAVRVFLCSSWLDQVPSSRCQQMPLSCTELALRLLHSRPPEADAKSSHKTCQHRLVMLSNTGHKYTKQFTASTDSLC